MTTQLDDRAVQSVKPEHRHRVEHLGNWLFAPDEVAWAKRLQVLPMPSPTGLRYVADVCKPRWAPTLSPSRSSAPRSCQSTWSWSAAS